VVSGSGSVNQPRSSSDACCSCCTVCCPSDSRKSHAAYSAYPPTTPPAKSNPADPQYSGSSGGESKDQHFTNTCVFEYVSSGHEFLEPALAELIWYCETDCVMQVYMDQPWCSANLLYPPEDVRITWRCPGHGRERRRVLTSTEPQPSDYVSGLLSRGTCAVDKGPRATCDRPNGRNIAPVTMKILIRCMQHRSTRKCWAKFAMRICINIRTSNQRFYSWPDQTNC